MYWWKSFVRVYWGSRVESEDDCATMFAESLNNIAENLPGSSSWSSEFNGRPCATNIDALARMLDEGKSRDDLGDVMDELGYSVTLHSGSCEEDWAMLSVSCGIHSTPSIVNGVSLFLPAKFGGRSESQPPNELAPLLGGLASAWQAEWGCVSTPDLDQARPTTKFEAAHAGWVTFLARARFPHVNVPSNWRTLDVDNFGTLVLAVGDQGASDREEDLRSVAKLDDWLAHAQSSRSDAQ